MLQNNCQVSSLRFAQRDNKVGTAAYKRTESQAQGQQQSIKEKIHYHALALVEYAFHSLLPKTAAF